MTPPHTHTDLSERPQAGTQLTWVLGSSPGGMATHTVVGATLLVPLRSPFSNLHLNKQRVGIFPSSLCESFLSQYHLYL